MRSAPLTTIKGGISRLRTKGGARADTLYDLLNGYVTEAGGLVCRPGTRRVANLDPLTRGLSAFGGEIYTFCHQAVAVPDGYRLGILAHPPFTPTGELETPDTVTTIEHTFTISAGRFVSTTTGTGYREGPTNDYGAIDDAALAGTDWRIVQLSAFGPNGTPDAHTQLYLNLNSSSTEVEFPETMTVELTFTGADAVEYALTLDDNPSVEGDGIASRAWRWLFGTSPFLIENGVDATFTLRVTVDTGAGVDVPSETIALEKIHFAEPFMGGLYVVAEFANGNIYHYWLQPGEAWAPTTAYKSGTLVAPAIPTGFAYRATRYGEPYPAWAPSVPRTTGDGYEEQSIVEPTTYNDFYYVCIETTGTNPSSGETEPAWPADDGATIVERTDGGADTSPVAATPPPTNVPSTPTKERYGLFGKTLRSVVRP